MKTSFLTLSLTALALTACVHTPKEAYFNRGAPESLLDVSSEVVNLKIDSNRSVQEITAWINKDQPTRAELSCNDGDALCVEVQGVLHQFSVPVKYVPSASNTVALVYERVLARDCNNRYIDNPRNQRNLNYPTYGCSIASNIVQMVGDKKQFTSPAIMDLPDANKANQTSGFYNHPAQFKAPKLDSNFEPITTDSDPVTLNNSVVISSGKR